MTEERNPYIIVGWDEIELNYTKPVSGQLLYLTVKEAEEIENYLSGVFSLLLKGR